MTAVGLELPLDAPRTAEVGRAFATHAFELPTTDEATLAAAFAIQLARYNGQAAIPIAASRVAWSAPLVVDVTGATRAGQVVEQVRAQLARPAAPTPRADGSRVAITWGDAPAPHQADTDLHLTVAGMRACFIYNAAVLTEASVARFAGHLRTLLAHLAPDTLIAQLPLLTDAERAWLDRVATGAAATMPCEPVHVRVERHAQATPDAIAVRWRDQALTYGELNRRANRLARALVARGATAESRVVVCLEPSLDIAIALLAILKSGAVYVPLDPSYPPARVAVILDDTKPVVTIGRGGLAVEVDGDDRDLDHPIDLADTAYIYYTSGTTGKPKGVMASHANLVTYLQVAADRYAITARDVMPASARFSFSISMFELMSPLAAGGTLVVLDRDHVLDPARLAATLATVTFFHCGPSLLKTVIAHLRRHPIDTSRVRHASSGGDLIAPEVLQALVELFPHAEVFVIYGCSEIACMGTTYPVPRDRPITRTFVGRPFDTVVARVLDRAGNPVPVGVPGEIHFGGGGVVKGYLDRPELTAQKFVVRDGVRFYNTGDLGRLSEDGWLEILGRNDFQIKIRGMRVELAEVEYHLRRAPGVKDGVAVARPIAGGDKALVAYVVLERPDAMKTLRAFMADQVPDYMVPAMYVELPSLPLNHNLKVDRNALPQAIIATAGRPPETATELAIAAAWRTLLDIPDVQLDHNFFELGGDSLRAMALIATVEAELGVRLDGLEVLRETLEVLAAICDRKLGRPSVERASVQTASASEPFFHGDLYCVLHGGRAATAALICAPPAHDRVRAHFVIAQLARRLADARHARARVRLLRLLGLARRHARRHRRALAARHRRRAARARRAHRRDARDRRRRAARRDAARGDRRVRARRRVGRRRRRDLVRAGRGDASHLRPRPAAPAARPHPARAPRHRGAARGELRRRDPACVAGAADRPRPRAARRALRVGRRLAPRRDAARHRDLVGAGKAGAEMREQTCKLGALAGIVTESGPRGCVLINAGLVPKFGPFRLYAELARELARGGITTLRFDLGGIGDSAPTHPGQPLAGRTRLDIAAAVEHLAKQCKSIVVGGLCSGAEDALRYAETDSRVTGVVMIDPFAYRTRGWHARNLAYRAMRRSLRALGVYKPLPVEASKRLVDYRHMPRDESARILQALIARRTRVHFIYTGGMHDSFNHPGQLAAMFPALDFAGQVTLDHFPRFDHTQLFGEDRAQLVEAIGARLLSW